MTATQIRFVKQNLPHAIAAGAAFAMNPIVILAQAALESGWGESRLAKEAKNFFGLMAYGCSNEFWQGKKFQAGNSPDSMKFRLYMKTENSFMDFARLIRNKYRSAWQMSNKPEAYAKEIAYSMYITELNGDNRELYRKSVVSCAGTIRAIVELIADWRET